jgi:O-antigen/teichoic acid export membrane protein
MTDELIQVAEDSVRGGFFLISGTALATIILAVTSIVTARLLGPELYGQYTLALVTPQLLFLFTDLGVSQGITKFTAGFRSAGKEAQIKRIVKYGLLLRTITGTAIFALNYLLADYFAAFFLQRPELSFYIRLASLAVLFQALYTTGSAAFVGLDKTEYEALTANITALTKATTSIALVLLGFGVAGAVIGHVASFLSAAITALCMLFILTRRIQAVENHGPQMLNTFRTLIRYGAPLYISLILIGVVPLYQNIVLAMFTTDTAIGNYKAAANFIALMSVISVPIATILLPSFSKLHHATTEKIRTFFQVVNKYTALIITPLAVLIILFANEIVTLIYGETYQLAPAFLAAYCTLYFLVGLGYLTLGSFYNGLGRTRTTMTISLITFIVLLALSPLLARTYGVIGAILALVVASATGTVYGFYIARRTFHVEFDRRALFKIYLTAGASAIPSTVILHASSLPLALTVAIGGLSYLLTYATLAPAVRIMTRDELQTALAIAEKSSVLKYVAKPVLKYEQKIISLIVKR